MKTLHYSIIIITGVILSLVFFHAPTASAHLIPSFSVQPDQNYTDPVTHYLNTKEGHPHIVIIRYSEFTLPMTLKSENNSKTTSYFIHVTDGNNFTAEMMPPGVSIRVLPNHFITSNETEQKFNIVIKVDKNAPSGVYEPNLVIKWNDNVTQSMEISSISFQIGKWNWDSLSKQVESGISKNDVVCKSSIQIVVIKSEDGSPACVKPDTAKKLIERGWAITGPKNFGINLGRGPLTLEN